MVRTWAVWNRNRTLGIVLAALACTVFVVEGYSITSFSNSVVGTFVLSRIECSGLSIISSSSPAIPWMAWVFCNPDEYNNIHCALLAGVRRCQYVCFAPIDFIFTDMPLYSRFSNDGHKCLPSMFVLIRPCS